MAYTEYKFDPEWIKKRTDKLKKSLEKNTGSDNLLEYGLNVVGKRLDEDPQSYRDYGPYWWALKKLLAKYVPDIIIPDMAMMDEVIANEYKGSTETETLVMADDFRNDYLKTFLPLTNEFMLNPDEPEPYRLIDSDMEQWAMAKKLGF